MGRNGVFFHEVVTFLEKIQAKRNVKLVGVMTHFPVADETKESSIDFTEKQIDRFRELKKIITQTFSNNILFHASNSGGTLKHQTSIFDLIRPGIASYGYPEHDGGIKLTPIMELTTKINLIKTYPKGYTIGYGCTYTTQKENETIGIIPIGYNDGFNRLLSNNFHIIGNGKKMKCVGRISMDQLAIQVGVDTRVGDEVVLVGKRGKYAVSIDELATAIQTITDEVICNIGNAQRLRNEYVYEQE
jgi:alanine racemase